MRPITAADRWGGAATPTAAAKDWPGRGPAILGTVAGSRAEH